MNKKYTGSALAVVVACAGVAQAAIYDNATSGKWEVAANWDTGRVPGDDGAGGTEQQNIIIVGNSQVTFDAATWTYLSANSLLHSSTEYRGALRLLMGESNAGADNGSSSLTFDHGGTDLVNITTGSSGGLGTRSGKNSTLNIESGTVNIGSGTFNVGGSGNGILNVNGGSLIMGRSNTAIGNGVGTGEININGGSFSTRAGITIGSNGSFNIFGSNTGMMVMGSGGEDGELFHKSGGVLSAGIDAGGISKIFLADESEGVVQANFELGSILDLGFYDGFTTDSGTWTLMELENGDIVDNGLALAAGDAAAGWSFAINNDGPNGILTVSVIPEPATLGLIAAFGGSILFIRRRFMI